MSKFDDIFSDIPEPPPPLKEWREALSSIHYDKDLPPAKKISFDKIQESLLLMAKELTEEAGCCGLHHIYVYSALLKHIRDKFCDGIPSFGFATKKQLNECFPYFPVIKEAVGAVPGLVHGIVEEGLTTVAR